MSEDNNLQPEGEDSTPDSGELDTAQAEKSNEKETAPSDKKPGESADKKDADDDTPAKPKGAQKRIGELTHNWRDAQRERDYWRDLALKGTQQPAPAATDSQPETPATAPPTLESVGYDEAKYAQEMAKWAAGTVDQKLAERDAQAKQTQQQQTLQQQFQSFSEKAAAFSQDKPDFDAVTTNPDLPISDTVRDLILSSDKGPEILYHLGGKVAEADRISRLDPTSAALEIGRLEARLSMPQPRQTSAPDPVKPVGGSGEPTTDTETNIDAWMEQRNKQLYS